VLVLAEQEQEIFEDVHRLGFHAERKRRGEVGEEVEA